jgi:hypothetical protein
MTTLPSCVVATFAALASGCVGNNVHSVVGHACIVLDIRKPGLCGAMQLVDGLPVVEVASGNHTMTDAGGEFAVAIPKQSTSAVLRVAAGVDDRRTSLVGVPSIPADDVLTPVITGTLWGTYLTALHVPPEDPATATLHVSFPFPGTVIGSAEVPGATQVLYDQGEAFDWAPTPPGDQTIAFMAFGVPVDTGSVMLKVVSRSDEAIFNAEVPVEAGAITWVVIAP